MQVCWCIGRGLLGQHLDTEHNRCGSVALAAHMPSTSGIKVSNPCPVGCYGWSGLISRRLQP